LSILGRLGQRGLFRDYIQDQVITGFAAFMMRARDYEDYIGAIHRKLLKEIANVPVS